MTKYKDSYWSNLKVAVSTLKEGLKLTWRHFKKSTKQSKPQRISEESYFSNYEDGLITVQYPHEMLPVPDNGRYRLHNEIDDCIVCDKCAKVCPVDCIDIEPVKSPEIYGHTSDGTPKRIHAAKFDIDMAKCCFCGLCTTVCPTECLTMTKTFDFSEYDVADHNYAFANLSNEEITKHQSVWEAFDNSKKDKVKPSQKNEPLKSTQPTKPIFKPRIKPKSNDS